MKHLSPRQHALAALGLTLLLGLLAWATLILPAHLLQRNQTERSAALLFQLQKMRQAADRLHTLQQEVAKLRQHREHQGEFLQGDTHSIAAAELQRTVKSLIQRHGGYIISTLPLDAQDDGTYPSVTVKVQMHAKVEQLQKVLYELETGQPRLFLDNVVLGRRHPSNFSNNQYDQDQLEVYFDVTGYLYQGEQRA